VLPLGGGGYNVDIGTIAQLGHDLGYNSPSQTAIRAFYPLPIFIDLKNHFSYNAFHVLNHSKNWSFGTSQITIY